MRGGWPRISLTLIRATAPHIVRMIFPKCWFARIMASASADPTAYRAKRTVMAKLTLTVACGDYDIIRPLKEGLVRQYLDPRHPRAAYVGLFDFSLASTLSTISPARPR